MLDIPSDFVSGNLYKIKKLEYKKDKINYHILSDVIRYGNLNILEYITYTLYYKINKDDLYNLIEISIENKRYHILKCLTDIIVKNIQQKKCTVEYSIKFINNNINYYLLSNIVKYGNISILDYIINILKYKINKYDLFDLIEISFENEQYHILKYLADIMVKYVDTGNRI